MKLSRSDKVQQQIRKIKQAKKDIKETFQFSFNTRCGESHKRIVSRLMHQKGWSEGKVIREAIESYYNAEKL